MKKFALVVGSVLASLVLMGAGSVLVRAASVPSSVQAKAIEGNPSPKHTRPELLKAYAGALGITIETLTQELNSKKTLYSLAKDKNMTKKVFRKKVGDQLQLMINRGELKGPIAKYYGEYIKWANSTGNK